MTATTERAALPSVTCFPWCSDGNGHGRDVFPEDQACISVPVQIPGSLLIANPEDTSEEPEYVAVHAQAWANGALPTMIHIGQSENYGLAVTLDEARQVAEAILRTIASCSPHDQLDHTLLDEELGLGVDNDDELIYLEGDMPIDRYVFSPKEARDLAYAILAHAARVEVLNLAPTVTA